MNKSLMLVLGMCLICGCGSEDPKRHGTSGAPTSTATTTTAVPVDAATSTTAVTEAPPQTPPPPVETYKSPLMVCNNCGRDGLFAEIPVGTSVADYMAQKGQNICPKCKLDLAECGWHKE